MTETTEAHVAKVGADPPIAAKRPKQLTIHGDTRIDNYFWLRDDDRNDPEVLAYLEAENKYFEAKTAHTNEVRCAAGRQAARRVRNVSGARTRS